MKEIPSPCINVCQHDSVGYCYGCRRTREEVGDWGLYTNKQKSEILKELESRKNADNGQHVFLR